jgi:hypothetical protein
VRSSTVDLFAEKTNTRPGRWLSRSGLSLLGTFCANGTGSTGQVEIVFAELVEGARGWRITVTLKHADSGWDHYANAWRIIAESGQILGERILHHPHVIEQPFTRSLGPVAIPVGTRAVYIEGQDSVHGGSAQRLKVDMRRAQGERFVVQHLGP